MRELGAVLRSTRESLGLDLDEIESRTKIRKRYLVALEEGDWNVLPGRVYARGFVRSYAEALGLDGAELLQSYVDGRDTTESVDTRSVENQAETQSLETPVSEEAEPSTLPKSTASEMEPGKDSEVQQSPRPRQPKGDPPIFSTGSKAKIPAPVRRPGGPIIQTLVIVLALVIVGGGYVALRHHNQSNAHANTTLANESSGSNGSGATSATNTSNGATTGNATSNTSKGGSSNSTTISTPAKPSVVITPQPLQNNIRTYDVRNVTSLDVVLKVNNGQLWLASKADGKTVNGNDTLNPGQSKTYHGNKSVSFRLGHVQGIQILVNGKALPLPNVPSAVNIQIVNQSG